MSAIGDNDFILSEGERHHPLWVRLSAHLSAKLTQARGKNDGALTQEETARLRGRISALKDLLALGDEPPRDG